MYSKIFYIIINIFESTKNTKIRMRLIKFILYTFYSILDNGVFRRRQRTNDEQIENNKTKN